MAPGAASPQFLHVPVGILYDQRREMSERGALCSDISVDFPAQRTLLHSQARDLLVILQLRAITMNSLQKPLIAVVLLLGASGTWATPIMWTDTTGLNPSAYTTLSGSALGISDARITLTGDQSLIVLLEDQGLMALLAGKDDKKCDNDRGDPKRCKRTVPEPGALSLIGLGIVGVALAIRRTRRLRTGFGTQVRGP